MKAVDLISRVNTMNAVTEDDMRFVRQSCVITVGRLSVLIDSYLQV
jgi:hypothetical protein